MIFYTLLGIPLSCYVGHSDMSEESKTAYFVTFGIVTVIIVLAKLLGGE